MSYRHTQRPFWLLLPVAAMIAVSVLVYAQEGPHVAHWITGGFVLLLLTLFFGLTVEVAERRVNLWFGVGLIRRSIDVDRIAAVAPVRTKWWHGWGIRLTPRGWMWNIAGFDAVELTYTNGKHFRIGTDDVAGLLRALEPHTAR